MDWITRELEELESEKRLRELQCRESPPVAGIVQIDGKQFINFSSNDYLGLAADTSLVEAVRHVIGQVGWGAGASPLVTGHGVWHRSLERQLARLKNTESALLFPTGFAANVGAITSLVGRGDLILSDEKNHASIIDGCRLSGATIVVFKHADATDAEQKLKENSDYERKLVVTDSLFSMDGDFAPLLELCEIAKRFGAMMMVDEAHATGVFGARGSGLCELLQVEQQVDVRVGTLSKALGSLGGFVAGSQRLIELVLNRARTYMFSTAQPEAISAASLAAINIVHAEPQRRTELQRKSTKLRELLHRLGLNCANSESQIIPVVIGKASEAVQLSQKLRDQGMLVPAIRPPAVPEGQSLLRTSLSFSHSDEQIEQLADVLSRC